MDHSTEFRKVYTCDAPSFLPDDIRERLLFLSCLSEKKSRSVFLVKDKETGDKCILKITDKQSPDSAKSEYEILSGLNHPGIPRCTFFKEDVEGREYILRSYMEGDVLSRLLDRDGAFKEAQIYDIVLKICAILRYLHHQQPPIIYRDINPCNIALTANGKVSLIDFGISKKIQVKEKNKSFNTVIVGTIPFISPEQMGYDSTDHRSDIFALGKLMLYLHTGQTDEMTFPADKKDPRFAKIIAKCTKQSKEKRFSSIKQLERAILWAQKKPVDYAFIKGAMLASVFVIVCLAFIYFIKDKQANNSFPSQTDVSIGAVDQNLPVRSHELIAAARRALNISDGTVLTENMLANITTIAINAEENSDRAVETGQKKAVLSRDCFTELKYFKNLSQLSIDGFQIMDLTPVGDLDLKSLSITNSSITNITALSKLTSLESLDLSNNPIEDIHVLAGLDNLKTLNLSYTYVRDITPLEKRQSLEEINLCATRTTDFSSLANLTGLSSLKISHVQIKDFSFLEKLNGLTHLELRSTGFGDLSMIKSTKLESLDISLNYNYLTDISGLEQFTGLYELDISLNDVRDYSPLFALSELRTLGIHEDQADRFLLSDEYLAKMLNLSKVILTANELTGAWKKINEQGRVKIVLRSYYEAY